MNPNGHAHTLIYCQYAKVDSVQVRWLPFQHGMTGSKGVGFVDCCEDKSVVAVIEFLNVVEDRLNIIALLLPFFFHRKWRWRLVTISFQVLVVRSHNFHVDVAKTFGEWTRHQPFPVQHHQIKNQKSWKHRVFHPIKYQFTIQQSV